jgi:hypothetical protein
MAMKKITKIVTFYDDGTFTESTPSVDPMPTPWNPPTVVPPVFHPPQNPYQPTYPWPNTVWCKTADGTVQEMTLTSPIVAQTTGDTNV